MTLKTRPSDDLQYIVIQFCFRYENKSYVSDLRLNFTNTATFVEKHLDILVAHILIVTTVLIVATMCCYIYRV